MLDGAAGLTDRQMTLLLSAETGALLVEKKVGDHDQSPETQNGVGRQELVEVEAEHVLAILKKGPQSPSAWRYVGPG